MKSGLLLVNKPEGPSSFDIIRILRKNLKIKKMGHAGTLDPLASGLLVVAVGQATKILSFLPTDKKEYHFTIQFGETRTTGDREGEVLEGGFSTPSKDELLAVLSQFRGEIQQVPPAFSAIKIDGKRAYELAREGKEVEMKARTVTIYSLELLSFDEVKGAAELIVQCSSGTYVRSLARDIAAVLNSGAYASRIHRTQVGPFLLKRAQMPEEILSVDSLQNPAIHMDEWGNVALDGKPLSLFRNGNPVEITNCSQDGSYLWVSDDAGVPVALGQIKAGKLAPVRVFPEW